MAEEPLYNNRLIHQKSPYLLQHAHNPVDWYPWGDEAFQAAKEQDKPIFLSIGYATCHWCHVMERESFENVEIAHLLNQTFINIKVDREELPDVDSLYMEFAQSMMSGAAGWPLNVLLTPDLQPFFAATYLPPYSSHGLMGLADLIHRVGELWKSADKEKVISQAETILEVFASSVHTTGESLPEDDVIEETIELLYKMADPTYGGMKGAPKFPIGYQSSLLLRYFVTNKDNRALFLVERTLDMMHRGGIYDHIGGGFSRYSVDERWIIPHFEKMLYDNAILAQSYLEAWQLTKKPLYREICEEILNYILRDMTHPDGGFFSAEDADSEGHEGYFYTWPRDEVLELLAPDGLLFCEYYHISPHGNFDSRNVLHQMSSLEEFAQTHHLSVEELQNKFKEQKKILWKAREKRVHPMKDDKVLTSWNGLMIYTLTEAGKAFDHEPFLQAAIKCARFLKKTMWIEEEQMLLRRWREGEALFAASLDEYAFLTRGLISLFEANGGIEWLQWAIELTNALSSHYKVPEGAFFQTDGTDKTLILQRCQFSDGAEPSGNAIHTENLLKLYQITKQEDYIAQASDVLMAVKDLLEHYPLGYTYHVMNLLRYYDQNAPTFIIALNSKNDYINELRKQLFERFIPHKNVIWQSQDLEFEEILPHLQGQQAVGDKTTLYLCQQGVCHEPITDLAEMIETIGKF